MEKIILNKENIEKNREAIIEAYAATSKKSSKLPTPTKSQRKLLGMGKNLGKCTSKYVRVAPRKVKIVADLIKGKSLEEAYAILLYTPKAASPVLMKALKSAEANAVNNNGLNRSDLYVDDAYGNQGPILKRFMPRAKGSANRINKRTSHVTVVLKERV
ncbi:MAG TPA: 50S ribosomal protein L22 [Saccharofermentans sp.]|nr:50S ribosomal protein L22 [Saccharofermentans sp.]HPJ81234.1 50S ribosomal protein L22 [Saccharofermentans sp.]HPQ32030.1 50S ribosomal protein L22 [Saccharofermentans sp.]HRV50631.1 50S ribosomal protein L22 [Saccharofermentans sp.]